MSDSVFVPNDGRRWGFLRAGHELTPSSDSSKFEFVDVVADELPSSVQYCRLQLDDGARVVVTWEAQDGFGERAMERLRSAFPGACVVSLRDQADVLHLQGDDPGARTAMAAVIAWASGRLDDETRFSVEFGTDRRLVDASGSPEGWRARAEPVA